jgi:hypothetical protein
MSKPYTVSMPSTELQICTSTVIQSRSTEPIPNYLCSPYVTHEISRPGNEEYWPLSLVNAPRPSKLARNVDGTNLGLSKISCGFCSSRQIPGLSLKADDSFLPIPVPTPVH